MTRNFRFLSAFLITVCGAVIANAIPYFLTRGAYQHDGQEVAGFPFSFHRIGGDCWPAACNTYNFSLGYFAADLALALTCALAAGFMAVRTGRGRRRA